MIESLMVDEVARPGEFVVSNGELAYAAAVSRSRAREVVTDYLRTPLDPFEALQQKIEEWGLGPEAERAEAAWGAFFEDEGGSFDA